VPEGLAHPASRQPSRGWETPESTRPGVLVSSVTEDATLAFRRVRTMAVIAVEEVEVSEWGTGPRPIQKKPPKKGPGRLRAVGLVALNPQPYCEGAGALASGQSRHPTVIHATAPGATMGGASGRLTTWGLAQMTVIR
jgi:hypothetical protein